MLGWSSFLRIWTYEANISLSATFYLDIALMALFSPM